MDVDLGDDCVGDVELDEDFVVVQLDVVVRVGADRRRCRCPVPLLLLVRVGVHPCGQRTGRARRSGV